MEVESKIDFSSDDEELLKFANLVDEACEQEDQIELLPDEEEYEYYDGCSVPLASYFNELQNIKRVLNHRKWQPHHLITNIE
ncbi:hypothetical protein PoB_006381100 [Plakobranchus ocellatus]|uniref:Uncharacterized protein n=1 Tax=Plakobranchus ocellatus TaxID=259542 RepID=A0AAV4CZZ1_9GAST|nr:hypothetical protein PoB_006381100 [Plakobranchus ocellatus]